MRRQTRSLLAPLLLLLGASLGACNTELPATDGHDEGYDSLETFTERATIDAELAGSPVHTTEVAFARLSFLHRSPERAAIEIQTSADGITWSAWTSGALSDEASDEAYGVWVSDVDVTDGEALHWRVRGAGDGLTELAVVTQTLDELAEEAAEGSDDEPEIVAAEDGVAASVESLRNFRRYRYDLGRVGRSWLYLLRTARSRGWRGTLYGPRTGLRTYAQQASLWNAYQNGTGAPAFPPWGPSRHLVRNVRRVGTWYQACDTNDVPNLIRIARNMGVSLHTPYGNEPWHVEARRSFGPPRGWRP